MDLLIGASDDYATDWAGRTYLILGYPHCFDEDQDGFGDPGSPECESSLEDCDDADHDVNPGADEDCFDGIDNDCDDDDTPADDDDGPDCRCQLPTGISTPRGALTLLALLAGLTALRTLRFSHPRPPVPPAR